MDSNFIHYVGFVGDTKDRSMTLTIKRGTEKSDVLFLLTKMLDAIQRNDISMLRNFNEVRISQMPSQMPSAPARRRAGNGARPD